MENGIYVHSHILCTDNTVKDLDMDISKFSFDYTKYLADDGDLYFIEEIKDGKTMRFIAYKNQFLQRKSLHDKNAHISLATNPEAGDRDAINRRIEESCKAIREKEEIQNFQNSIFGEMILMLMV